MFAIKVLVRPCKDLEVEVTLTMQMDIGLFGGFGTYPVTLHAKAQGKGEVYWK